MTSDRRTEVPQPSDSQSQTELDVRGLVSHDGPMRDGEEQDQAPDAHFGAVDGETTPILPPMHGYTDSASDGTSGDEIDPVDEITPG